MLPTIENSEKFKTEFRNFKEKIASIESESLKKDLNQKLTELLREVRTIDSQHQDLLLRKDLPSLVPETRNRLMEVRRYIIKKLEDYDRARAN